METLSRTLSRTGDTLAGSGVAVVELIRERTAAELRSICGRKEAFASRRFASVSSMRATAMRMSLFLCSALATSSFSFASPYSVHQSARTSAAPAALAGPCAG